MRPAVRAALAIALWPIAALVVAAAMTPLPPELREGHASESVRFVDREGALLREVRADDATRARWIGIDEVGPNVVKAVLAAEDQRFDLHPGVDPIAVARAAVADVTHRRIVSGASTLTMQLARVVRPHRRDVLGKLGEMALALRIEASLSKRAILEQYVNRAPFGPGIRGIEAASRYYFDKPTRALSLAEAAALAAIPRGPSVYAPERHADRLARRRDRILDRMRSAGFVAMDDAERAKKEPLVVRAGKGSFGAPHLVAALRSGALAGADSNARVVVTTIDRDVEREAEEAARAAIAPLASRHVTAAAAIAIDNATGEVLAYVGSPDFSDDAHGGQNDGVRALRQPGSALKPFVYGLAMERLGYTPATVLPDIELHVPLPSGVYSPTNYDERFHGPVRLREALANSLNVPAVWTTEQIGAAAVLERLREVGLTSLGEAPDHYGPAIALGDGEVTLLELANAYAAIARDGVWRPLRATRSAPHGEERRVMTRDAARALADILADPHARMAAFGASGALDFPFEVAFKTGTSKGYRDNWTIGFTREVTVGVWVGNFDGSPMRGVSGITGAAPLFRAVMLAAMRGRAPSPLRVAKGGDDDFARVDVCALSGGRATKQCAHVVHEIVPRAQLGAVDVCRMHESVRVDRRNGLLAGSACGEAVARTFERFDGPFAAWAKDARREVAPTAWSPLCPAGREEGGGGARDGGLRIAWPHDGARFLLDPERGRAEQVIAIRVDAPRGAKRVDVRVDGVLVQRVESPFVARWALAPGEHAIVAEEPGGGRSAGVRVVVD